MSVCLMSFQCGRRQDKHDEKSLSVFRFTDVGTQIPNWNLKCL